MQLEYVSDKVNTQHKQLVEPSFKKKHKTKSEGISYLIFENIVSDSKLNSDVCVFTFFL